jgi:hypothetical protein
VRSKTLVLAFHRRYGTLAPHCCPPYWLSKCWYF